MIEKTQSGYTALVHWETTGELPDEATYLAAGHELLWCENLVNRYRRFIDACERHENTRHSRPSNWPPSSGRPARDGNDG